MQNAIETIKTLTYGTELEYTHISREAAARAIHSVVGGHISHQGRSYDAWTVTATDGRIWKAVSDASFGSYSTTAEVVTPILQVLSGFEITLRRGWEYANRDAKKCVMRFEKPGNHGTINVYTKVGF